MAETAKAPKKLKFLNFAKVVGICLGAVFGLIGISLGIIALTGGFNPPYVELEDLKFEQNVYVIDGNLEKTQKQDGNAYHIDYQTRVDADENPIYETIKAIPTNEKCTELDATLKILTGNPSIQIVLDKNTKALNVDENDEIDESNLSEFSIRLNSDIKIKPKTETKIFVDENGDTFEREVNKGGWTLLEITQRLHVAYCYVYVDVPVYEYQIVAQLKNGLTAYHPTGEEQEGDFVPDYLVDNSSANSDKFSFNVSNGDIVPALSFDTVYKYDPSESDTTTSLRFVLKDEIQKLYPRRNKIITYKSSDTTVATVNEDGVVTVQPNSYGKTFEISSYVVAIYNDEARIPQREEYIRLYPAGEAEQKYNEDFDKLRKYSLNTLKFRVNTLEISAFEVSQEPLSYYVFDQSYVSLTRDGSSKKNSYSDGQSTFNFTIQLNQQFLNIDSKLDEIKNNISVSAVYLENGEYKPYDVDGAVYVQVDDFGAKKIIVNKQSSKLSYLKFEFKQGESDEGFVAYCPITIKVHDAKLTVDKSILALKYYKKQVEGETNPNNVIDFDDLKEWQLDYDLDPVITAKDGKLTYSKIMYFISFAEIGGEQTPAFVEVDESQSIVVSGETFYALKYSKKDANDQEIVVNNAINVLGSGANAKLIVAIVKTSLPNGQGDVLVEDGKIQYYALVTDNSNNIQYVLVSADEQFEIDKCILVIGGSQSAIDLTSEELDSHILDLYNTVENPVIPLSKQDLHGNSTYATLIMTYYGTLLETTNLHMDYTRLNSVVGYIESSDLLINYDEQNQGVFCVTFNAITNGTAKVIITADSNPVWSKTITFTVSEDIISEIEITDVIPDNIIEAQFTLESNKITFEDVVVNLEITPNNSQASKTFVRSFTLSQAFIDSLCEQLQLDSSTATLAEILAKLNNSQFDAVRKSLGDLGGDSNVVDIAYENLDEQIVAKIKSAGNALVVVFALTNNEVNLASDAIIIRVPELILTSSTFEQEKTYKTLGDINGNLLRIQNGMNYGVEASTTKTSYNIAANNQFTLNGGAIDFSALKFAFENGTTTSSNGSIISNGIITFGAVDEKITEKLFAYIGTSYTSNFCKYEMKFVLEPDYKATLTNQTIQVNANEYVDLFELVDREIDGNMQKVPSIIVTNKDGNKLFLPHNYDLSKMSEFGQDFLAQFYYSEVGGTPYYHIYLTLSITGEIISGNIINGEVKVSQSGMLNIVSVGSNAGCIVAKVNVQVVGDSEPSQIYDIEVGALYYCNPSKIKEVQNISEGTTCDLSVWYDYVQFVSSDSVAVMCIDSNPDYFINHQGFGGNSNCTSTIENGKKIYSFTTASGRFEIYATSQTTIHFKSISEESQYNFEMDLVKYVA